MSPFTSMPSQVWSVSLFALALGSAAAQPLPPKPTADEPTDFSSESTLLAAPMRCAMVCALSPDEKWIATGYGRYTHLGQVCVWDVATGKIRWRVNEDRGVRGIAVSPDAALVAAGNYGGYIKLRDATTGEIKSEFREAGSIEGLAFSPDGQRLASCSNSRLIHIWDVKTAKTIRTMTGHMGRVNSVQFSADGKRLLTAGLDKTVRLWNALDGRAQQVFSHPEEVSTAIFLPTQDQVIQDQIATACSDGQARIFNIETGQLETTLAAGALLPPAITYSVAASADGKRLASNCGSSVHVWDIGSSKLLATHEGHADIVFGLAMSRDGNTVVSAGWDTAIRIWDVAGQEPRRTLILPDDERGTSGPIRALAVSPDGKQVAVTTTSGAVPLAIAPGVLPPGNGAIQLRDRITGALIRTLAEQQEAWSLAFSPDGTSLAGGCSDGVLRWWNLAEQDGSESLDGHSAPITSVDWSPDGKLIASASADGTIRLRHPAQRREVGVLEGHTEEVTSLAFTPDGKRLISGSSDTQVIVWNVEKRAIEATLTGHTGVVRAVAVSPDGAVFATGGDDLIVRLWDSATLRPRSAMKGHQQPVSSLAFSPQGRTLASGGTGGGVMLWDVARGVARKTLNGHTGPVTGVCFLPDGSGLLSSGVDASVRLWKANVGSIAALVSVPAHQPKAYAVKFSPDGRWIASGGENKLVTLRDPNTLAVRQTLSGHGGLIYDLAFSPDGKRLATASADGTVRVWSVYQGTLVATYDAWGTRRSNIRSVAFSADGREIASGSEDGTIMLWNVAEDKVRKKLPTQALPVLCVRYSPDGSLLASSTGMNQRPQEMGELRLWNSDTGEEIARLEGHTTEIKRLAFDTTGRRMVSAGDRSIIVWNVAERMIQTRFQAEAVLTSVAFLADSDLLATGDARGGVLIYSIDRGAVVHHYAGHQNIIPAIAVRPDQQTIATVSHDGTLKLWPGPATIEKQSR